MDHSTSGDCPDSIAFPRKLEAARRGDRWALQALFEDYYPQVERIVHAHLRRGLGRRRACPTSRFSTADVVQDVFHSLIRSFGAFTGETQGEFVAYMLKLIRSRTLDTIRHHRASCRDFRRNQGSPETVPSAGIAVAQGTSSMSDEADADLHVGYRAALERLPEAAQGLLRARIERGLGFEELARELGYPSRYAARRAFYSAQARLIVRMKTAGIDVPRPARGRRAETRSGPSVP